MILTFAVDDFVFNLIVAVNLHVPDFSIFTRVPLILQTVVLFETTLVTEAPLEGDKIAFVVNDLPFVAVFNALIVAPLDNLFGDVVDEFPPLELGALLGILNFNVGFGAE